MRAEVPLSDTSESLVEHTVLDFTEASVRVCLYKSHLAVMITCDKQILSLSVDRYIASAHTVDAGLIDQLKVTVFLHLKYRNALVRR